MLTALNGIYKDGRVELFEKPPGIDEVRIVVTFLATSKRNKPKMMLQYGKYAGPNMSTEEDLKHAEWHGEPEFDEPADSVRR